MAYLQISMPAQATATFDKGVITARRRDLQDDIPRRQMEMLRDSPKVGVPRRELDGATWPATLQRMFAAHSNATQLNR